MTRVFLTMCLLAAVLVGGPARADADEMLSPIGAPVSLTQAEMDARYLPLAGGSTAVTVGAVSSGSLASGFGTISSTFPDNTALTCVFKEGSNCMFALTTTNGSEVITLGNVTTNPALTLRGTGLTTLGGGLTVTGGTTLSNTDVRGSIFNGGASSGGAVGFTDDTVLTGANPAYQIIPTAWGSNAFYFQAGVTVTGAAGGNYAYLGVPSGKGMVHYIGSQRAIELTGTEVVFSTVPKLPISTYATTDCDASAERGRMVMHDDGANHVSGCLCEQTGATTYAFKAMSATGVCP